MRYLVGYNGGSYEKILINNVDLLSQLSFYIIIIIIRQICNFAYYCYILKQ